jgi:hypothetical protein
VVHAARSAAYAPSGDARWWRTPWGGDHGAARGGRRPQPHG